MPGDRSPDGVVTLWQQPDGRWRWQWAPSADGDPGPISHKAFDSPEKALGSAAEAYPGAALPEPPREPVRRRRRRLLLTLALAALVVVAVRPRRRPD